MTAIFSREYVFELMIVGARKNPDFVRDAGSVGAEGIIIAGAIHNALGLARFLAQDVAEDATLAFAEPFAGGPQLVENPSRDESRGCDLRMGVRPFFTGLRAGILEHGDVFEARVAFQIGDAARPRVENALDFFVGHLREGAGVVGRFDYDFVCAYRGHAVVNAFGAASGIAFDAIEGAEMRVDAYLPFALRRQIEKRFCFEAALGAKRTGIRANFFALRMPSHNPTASDWIFAKFHHSPKAKCEGDILYREAGEGKANVN